MSEQSIITTMDRIQHVFVMLKDLNNYNKEIRDQYPHLAELSYVVLEVLNKDLNKQWHLKVNVFFQTLTSVCSNTLGIKKIATISSDYVLYHLNWTFNL